MAKQNRVKRFPLNFFAMGEDCEYSFVKPPFINIMPLRNGNGFLVVSRGFDEYFTGSGKTESEAFYNWKVHFHYYFQLFSRHGVHSDADVKLYNIMQDILDMKVYDRHSTTNRLVLGTIEECRTIEHSICLYSSDPSWSPGRNNHKPEKTLPTLFRLEGSDELCEVPSLLHVDPSFLLLKKGDRFRGVFEYRDHDNALIRIHFAKRISKKNKQ
jgi:hypothetical protein